MEQEKTFMCSADELGKAVEDGANIYDVFKMLFGEKPLMATDEEEQSE